MPAPPPPPPGYAVAQILDLQAALRLARPLTATIEVPTGGDAATGEAPVRVCFTSPSQARPDCGEIRKDGYGAQTLVSARVETLSKATKARALVVRADYSGGADSLRIVAMWTCSRLDCLQSFSDDFTDIGEAEVLASGPLAGSYVDADFVQTRPDEARWDPHRFSIRVYRLDPSVGGYVQVLQYVTAKDYPAERERAGQVIAGETPRIERLLKTVYPAGPPD